MSDVDVEEAGAPSTLGTYRRNPTTIRAVRWTGRNRDEVEQLANDAGLGPDLTYDSDGFTVKTAHGDVRLERGCWLAYNEIDLYPIVAEAFDRDYTLVPQDEIGG